MKFLSVLIFGLALACSSGNSSTSDSESNYYVGEELKSADLVEEVQINEQLTPKYQKEEQKIIKKAQLRFPSDDLENTHKQILQLVEEQKGFIQSDNAGKSYNQFYRDMVVRVPTENFQPFLNSLSEGVKYFDQRDISRIDVTEEFVDLSARLKAKRELEERYLQLLKQAKNVKEMLEIERELSNIREEIEAKQGRLNYLQNRVSLSTITISFYKQTSETGVTLSYGQKMKNALKGGWDGISVFFLGLLYLWPLFVVAIITILLIRSYIKRSRKKKAKD